MSDFTKDQILIVGAGPTGMVVAAELARRGVPCRLIERRAGPSDSSRAFTVHARTMEIFDLIGIVDTFQQTCTKSFGFRFNFDGLDDRPTVDFRTLRSRYPYITLSTQYDTERVLRTHLSEVHGIEVEWQVELQKFHQDDDGNIEVTILNKVTGETEDLTPAYVVGADGIHSFVRKSLGLPFEGELYENMIMQMMDTETEGAHFEPDWIQFYMKEKTFLMTSPLPNGTSRILVSDQGETARHEGTRVEAFQDVLENFDLDLTIKDPVWVSQWVIWKRLADIYAKGNAYLAGDSAHVHSPTGGQGMNSCIQDGWNLGWKLAMVAKGEAKASLLDSYELERKPIGKQLIAGTDALHSIMMAHGVGMEDRLDLTRSPNWERDTAELVGGLTYTYRDQIEPIDGVLPLIDGPVAGDRAPDGTLGDGVRLYEKLRHGKLTAVVFALRDEAAQARAATAEIERRFGKTVATLIADGDDPALGEAYGKGDQGRVYVVRPDGYVGFRCALSESDRVADYFDSILETEVAPA